LTRDAKKEPFKKEKHFKPLGSKSSSRPTTPSTKKKDFHELNWREIS
jgi:hypothetical protein